MVQRRALMVGAGNFARTWGAVLHGHDDVEVVGWVDILPNVAADAASQLSMGSIYTGTDMGAALDELSPDFVVNLTIPAAHRDVSVQVLDAGFPVLCEKPMAESMAQARDMVAAAERSGKLLVISQQRRYNAELWAFRRLVQDQVGPLAILDSGFYLNHPAGGFRDAMSSPLLQDMAIHTFDVARLISGADPVSVYCEHFNPPWSWYQGPACAVAQFVMTGELHYTYRGGWCSQGLNTPWEADWRAVGPNGTAVWSGQGTPVAELTEAPGTFPPMMRRVEGEPDPSMATGVLGSLQAFLHALDSGETPMGECHDNIKSLAMVFGAVESAETGRRVEIEL